MVVKCSRNNIYTILHPQFESRFLGHDFPSSLPLPPSRSPSDRVLLPVQETVHYSLSGDASDNEWSNLTSAGFGYAHLGPDSRLFMVGMFHELHCLRVLNFAFDRSHKATGDHVHHCLNYLRQMALCSADVTLEPGDFTKRNFDGSRTGSVHVCRDWSALYDAMEENWVQWEDVDGDDTSARTAASL
ncbi:hypothetical protein ARMGADRAFT_1045234 [Armillaria gallica]|uniref:Oxidase ustYa n=1 Tax=Armillaria gallica TaxID=47427 RepID=A0A2H3DL46_ARMGA|nr:hypothetical protein ARMGADRAFT_1045234 [Armillaria gallica]